MSVVDQLARELGVQPHLLRRYLRRVRTHILPRKCEACQTDLAHHERPDGYCTSCLRANQTATNA